MPSSRPACAANAADLLAHLSTADTARDLEQLRLAGGGEPLNFWGVSYGTFLGATYAGLFPEHIRALVLDGNLSPLAWTANGDPDPQWPLGDRIGSYQVAEVFDHFLQLCAAAGPERCAFAAKSYGLTRQKWDDLLDRLSEGPIELKSKDGVRSIVLETLVGQVSDGMDIVWALPGASGWASIAGALQALHEAGKVPPPYSPQPAEAVATPPAAPSAGSGPASYDGAEGVFAVMCGDSPTVTPERWATLASEVVLRSGYFGLSTSFTEFAVLVLDRPGGGPLRGSMGQADGCEAPRREHHPRSVDADRERRGHGQADAGGGPAPGQRLWPHVAAQPEHLRQRSDRGLSRRSQAAAAGRLVHAGPAALRGVGAMRQRCQTEDPMQPLARTAALLPLALLVPTLASAEAVPVPVLAWDACPPAAAGAASTDGLQCATAPVPMDYADPSGPGFSLALIKAPARDPATRIGTLFWNPGGPGDAGTSFLPAAIGGFPAEVRDRFDIVSWDPRGMGGRTTPVVQCFDSAAAEAAFLGAHLSDSLPVTPEELVADAAGRAAFNAACVARNGTLLEHVSTADNARDLDLLREAVGEDKLSYYGTSYGTFLGATYVNMFPGRVRAAVLDGAVTPSAWAGGPGEDMSLGTFLRIGSDFGAAQAVGAFMDQCGAVDAAACAFSAGSPEATRRKWSDLLKRAAAGLTVDGQTIDDGDLLVLCWRPDLYGLARCRASTASPAGLPSRRSCSTAPDGAAEPGRPPPPTLARPPPPPRHRRRSTPPLMSPAPAGNSPSSAAKAPTRRPRRPSPPRSRRATPVPAIRRGPSWHPATAGRARAADPYLGPWDNPTPAPVLVVGNTYDPATPLASSVRMAQELADGRLLIVNGFGHTVLINPSRCAQDHIAAYLIDGRLPPAGASCTPGRTALPRGLSHLRTGRP